MNRELGLCAALALIACGSPTQADDASIGDSGVSDALDAIENANTRPRIIIVIGDGMGETLQEVASRYSTGAPENLSWHQLGNSAEILTASASGVTDSAAAATAMATGEMTYNGRLSIDRDGAALSNLFEIAKARGLATGLVTTATPMHATTAAFSAHALDRYDYELILEQQVRASQPDVILGGGLAEFSPELLDEIRATGSPIVFDAASLKSEASTSTKIVGLFADAHFPYALDRAAPSDVPSLSEMTSSAIEILDRDSSGFLLVLEAARIDRACHDSDLTNAVGDTLELSQAVASIADWSSSEEGVTLLVLADHETGGLSIDGVAERGTFSQVSWQSGRHTNRRVRVYGQGPGTEMLSGVTDHRVVFAIANAAITRAQPDGLNRLLIANGDFDDVRFDASQQIHTSDADGRLERMMVDADRFGIAVAIEGTFSRTGSSLVVLVDRDYGQGAGATVLSAVASSSTDPVDRLLSNLALDLSGIPGFAADFAHVSVAATGDSREQPWPGSGLRLLRASDGAPLAPLILGAALTFDECSVGLNAPAVTSRGRGAELFLSFDRLYPETGGVFPPGTKLAVVAVMTSLLGTTVSNQALPPFGPSSSVVAGVVTIEIDRDGDGQVDDAPRISSVTIAP